MIYISFVQTTTKLLYIPPNHATLTSTNPTPNYYIFPFCARKSMAKGMIMFVLVAIAMIQFMVKPGQAVTCGQVDSSLAPCIPYLTGGGTPTAACCSGVKNIKAISSTTADKREACNCVKEAAARYQNIKDDYAVALPTKCNVEMDIPISRNTNCDIVKA